MIRKNFDIFGGALLVQKKLLQEYPVKPTNTFADLKKIIDNKEKLLKSRKRLSKSSINIEPSSNSKKSSNSDFDEKDEVKEKKKTISIVLNKKIKLSKRNSNNLCTKPKSSTIKPLKNYNNKNDFSNNPSKAPKKFELNRSASSHETSKITFNNSSTLTFKTNNSFNNNNNNNIKRSSTSYPFRQNVNSNSNAKQILLNKFNENKTNIESQEPQQLDKRQRFDIYMKLLDSKPGAKSVQEAIVLINSTLDEVEEKHAPKKDDKVFGLNSKKYGRMNTVPEERIKINPETGKMEMLTTGLTIVLEEDGSFDIWTIKRGNFDTKRVYHKNGLKIASNQ